VRNMIVSVASFFVDEAVALSGGLGGDISCPQG